VPSSLPDSAQVVIVGGGFAGAATAYWLARFGVADVVVVEREATCGYHASGRNAAMGRQITENPHFTDVTVPGAAFLRRPPEGFAAGFADGPLLSGCGSLLLAQRSETLERVAGEAARRDVAHRVVDAAAIERAWPLLRGTPTVGAVAFPGDGVIDIHALLLGFLAGARAGGARVVTSCEVRGFRPVGAGVDVVTSRGTVNAATVVVAAGAWAEPVGREAGASRPFDPVHRHLFVTEPVADVDAGAPFAWHLDDEFYVRPEVGGLLVSGCDESVRTPADARPDSNADVVLAGKLERVAPGLLEFGVARRWACLRTFSGTADRAPLVGPDNGVPWLFWVAGLGGHGATASAEIGRRAARALAGL